MPMQSSAPPRPPGPWSASRDPKSYPSARKALIPDKQQDWVYARTQYEIGTRTAASIAADIGVGPTAVYARASTEGWTKNPEARAQHLAEVKIAAEAKVSEAREVEQVRATRVNAEMQARMLIHHRQDIQKARTLTIRLFQELEDMMNVLPELERLGELLRDENERGQDKLNDTYQKIIAFAGRVDVNKKLSEALKTQLQLERQAFGVIGALEDPEVPIAPTTSGSDIDKILGKFDLILKSKSGPANPTGLAVLGEIVDVP